MTGFKDCVWVGPVYFMGQPTGLMRGSKASAAMGVWGALLHSGLVVPSWWREQHRSLPSHYRLLRYTTVRDGAFWVELGPPDGRQRPCPKLAQVSAGDGRRAGDVFDDGR